VEDFKPDSILIAEFEYIAQSAFQVSEDRAKVSSFYLITVGSFFAAILGVNIQTTTPEDVYRGFAFLFLVLSLNSLITLGKLVQLRLAWLDSVKAMNAIKECYLKHSGVKDLESAFLWRKMPGKFRRNSISFMLALEVALLGAITCGTGVMFFGLSYRQQWWVPAIVGGLIYLAIQIAAYRYGLRETQTDS
jgi:hypothetical protein